MPIGFFQLDNLIQQRVRFLLFSSSPAEQLGLPATFLFHVREILKDWNPEEENFEQIQLRLKESGASKEAPIVFICEDGEKSKALVNQLVEAGYINTFYALGGRQELLKGP